MMYRYITVSPRTSPPSPLRSAAIARRRDTRRRGPGPYVVGLQRARRAGRGDGFPFTVHTLDLDAPVTLLADEGGAGTSTIVEAVTEVPAGGRFGRLSGPPEPERDDLVELRRRRALTEDAARPDAVARRRARRGRTARENLADLVDPGSFVEYGRFAIAAQRGRRDLDDLVANTPADGLVGGTARIDGRPVAVLSYDATVLAGTQGALGHRKKDRLFELIERMRLPTVLFAEGGGGRPGDTDHPVVSALDVRAFALWAGLSGKVPRIAIVNGRCFAGNAVLAGCSDLVVATEDASLGMGGRR